jgi:hypothetical protein
LLLLLNVDAGAAVGVTALTLARARRASLALLLLQHGLHEVPQLLQHCQHLLAAHGICLGQDQRCGHLEGHCHGQVLARDACDSAGGIHTQQRVVCRGRGQQQQQW